MSTRADSSGTPSLGGSACLIRFAVAVLCVCWAGVATLPVAHAQEMFDAISSLPLEGEEPAYRVETPRPETPTTRPTTAPGREPPPPPWDYLAGDWFGVRPDLAQRGVIFDLTAVGEINRNFAGGLDTDRTTGQYLINANLTLETEPLFGWKGGKAFVSFQHHDGVNPSLRDVGDWQWVSNLSADRRSQVSEAWYEQYLAGKFLKLKAGKIDVVGDFGIADYAAEFLNGGMGFPVTSTLLPTYPDPAFGAELFLYPTDHFYIGAGVFDGALHEGVRTGANGPRTLWHPPGDLFLIAEAGVTWTVGDANLPGRIRVGGWNQTATFTQFTGGQQDGASDFYVILDQRLWLSNPKDEDNLQGIGLFLGYDWADPDVFEADHHVDGGLAWTGPVPQRPRDVLGLGASWVHFSRDAGFITDDEMAMELFYKIQVTPWLSIKPDLQYVLNPGGNGRGDALVATVRFVLAL